MARIPSGRRCLSCSLKLVKVAKNRWRARLMGGRGGMRAVGGMRGGRGGMRAAGGMRGGGRGGRGGRERFVSDPDLIRSEQQPETPGELMGII